jgi:hypothetical protein
LQGIYSYVPGIDHVSKVLNIASILCLKFMTRVTLGARGKSWKVAGLIPVGAIGVFH